ncbi:MAG TPA: hypothetical protein VOA64_14640 [Candidatus Dormibacteraeota bacterium]|nr:hypothetical protein [Candidatus Dormibacteraeota bacterium]
MTITSIQFNRDNLKKLRQISRSEHRSVGSLVREAVRDYLEKKPQAAADNKDVDLTGWVPATDAEKLGRVPQPLARLERRLDKDVRDLTGWVPVKTLVNLERQFELYARELQQELKRQTENLADRVEKLEAALAGRVEQSR